jgi:hypothetical protein
LLLFLTMDKHSKSILCRLFAQARESPTAVAFSKYFKRI